MKDREKAMSDLLWTLGIIALCVFTLGAALVISVMASAAGVPMG